MKKSIINTLVFTAIAATPLFISAQTTISSQTTVSTQNNNSARTTLTPKQVATIVNGAIAPLVEKQDIPGMAVAVFYDGKPQFFNYGVADKKTGRPVTENTLFELGSVSKTFTGIAGEYAAQTGIMNLNDPVTKYAPELTGSQWKDVKMLHLATYTAGGLPLQLPDSVIDQKTLWQYYQQWQPQWAPGVMRNYSNASIGLFGALAVKRSQLTFENYMTQHVFHPLKLDHTFITVPEAMQSNYAWGYKDGQPVRVTLGMLGEEAYGVKSSSHDMVRFLQANMNPNSLPAGNDELKKAIIASQSRYFQAGEMFQGLGWEMYNWPINPQHVVADSGNDIALKPRKVEALVPPLSAMPASWVHKTGATNGFGAYIVFIPEENIGIVMLANKNYPNPVRVQAAYNILQALR